MNIEVLDTVASVAQRTAEIITAEARAAVAARGRFVMAVSGGHTPWLLLRARTDMPWSAVQVVKIDERVAPTGHPDRNITHLRERFFEHTPLPAEHIHEMPIEGADLETATAQYASTLSESLESRLPKRLSRETWKAAWRSAAAVSAPLSAQTRFRARARDCFTITSRPGKELRTTR